MTCKTCGTGMWPMMGHSNEHGSWSAYRCDYCGTVANIFRDPQYRIEAGASSWWVPMLPEDLLEYYHDQQ